MQSKSDSLIPYAVSGFFAAALFAINYGIGSVITIATGTPGASGLITGFTTAFTMYLACYVLGTGWRGGMIVFGLYCLAAWPTVLMGPPGWHKVITGALAGAVFGWALRFDRTLGEQPNAPWLRTIVAWVAFTVVIVIGTLFFFNLLELPGKDRFMMAIWIFAVMFFALGLLGIVAARKIAPKLSKTETYRQLRETN